MSLANPDESAPCRVCGVHDFLPVSCAQCGGSFCAAHGASHPKCAAGAAEVRTVADTSAVPVGVSLESLYESAKARERLSRSQPQQVQQQRPGAAPTAAAGRALGSALPPGLHRNRRFELFAGSDRAAIDKVSTAVVVIIAPSTDADVAAVAAADGAADGLSSAAANCSHASTCPCRWRPCRRRRLQQATQPRRPPPPCRGR